MDVNNKSKLIGIQLLRICACVGVFLVHLGQRLHFSGSIRTLTDFGAYGVEMFFIISGYLALYNSDREIYGNSALYYYAKRAIRLLPLYYLVTLFYFITETFVWHTVNNNLGWLRELFLTHAILNRYDWVNPGGTWTIHYLACFYLLAPLISKIIKSTKSALLFFIISYLAGHMIALYGGGWFDFFIYLPYISLGILVFYAEKEGNVASVSLLLCCLTLFSIVFSRKEEMIYSPVFGLMILLANQIKWSDKIAKFASILDPYTYTLYLVHCIVVCGILDKFALPTVWSYLIGFGGSILLTVVIYNFYERPIYICLRKRVENYFEKKH